MKRNGLTRSVYQFLLSIISVIGIVIMLSGLFGQGPMNILRLLILLMFLLVVYFLAWHAYIKNVAGNLGVRDRWLLKGGLMLFLACIVLFSSLPQLFGESVAGIGTEDLAAYIGIVGVGGLILFAVAYRKGKKQQAEQGGAGDNRD